MSTYTPFGFHYSGNSVSIKLRFTQKKYEGSNLEQYGNVRYTKNGYILFETTVQTTSDKFRELSNILNQINSK